MNSTDQQVAVATSDDLDLGNDDVCLAHFQKVLAVPASAIKLVFGGAGCLPPPFQDRARFIGLVKLVVDKICMTDEIALFSARDFALAELELHGWSLIGEQMLRNKRRAYLSEKIEAGLRQEGVPEAHIKDQKNRLIREYIDLKTRRDVMDRFGLPGLDQIDAEIIRCALPDVARIDQRLSHHRRQRDQAIKFLETYSKLAAQRLREIARHNEQARAQIRVANIEPAPALTRK